MNENELSEIIESLQYRITHLQQQVSKLPQTPEQSEQITQTFTEINALLSNNNTPDKIPNLQRVNQLQAKLTAIVEATSDLVGIADVTRRILYLNPAGYQLLGIDPSEDITTHDISEFHTPEADNQIVNLGIPIAIKDGVWTGETTLRKCNGEIFPVSQVIIAHKSDSGEIDYLSTIVRDISNRKQIEEALRQSQFLIQQITETTPQILYIHDLITQGNIYVNRQIFDILGYTPETVQQQGRRFFISTLHPHDLPAVIEHLNSFTNVADGEVREVEYRIQHANGTWRWLCNRDVVFSRTPDGLPKQILGTARDINQSKLIEMALWESESRLHTLVNSISDGILLVDYQGIIHFVNPEAINLFGRSLEELVDSQFGIPSIVNEVTELGVNHPSRGLVILEMRTAQTLWQGEEVYVVTLRDITQRLQAQAALRESEERFRQLAENIEDVFWLSSLETPEILYISSAYEKIWGRSCKSLYTNPNGWIDAIHPEDREIARNCIERKRLGEFTIDEYRIIRPDGEIRWICTRTFPIHNESGKAYRSAGIAEDISDRKKADELIQASLREKEVLLKEIHHRVKNNLQIISSLLRLQANRIDDEGVRVILQESQSRVESMALVHESLYRSENFSQIDFTQYVENLGANLFRTYNVQLEANSFKLHVADGLFISLAQAVPCGLIINELISNALKHGFPNHPEGEVSLTLEASSNRQALLTVGNKGNTLPADFDLQKTQSMGLKLVITLVKQLKGTIDIERGDITLFKIQFPLAS